MFSVIERHRKKLGILWSDGENRGRLRRSQEHWTYCQGSWLWATAGYKKNCRNVGYKSIENQACGVGWLMDLTRILKNYFPKKILKSTLSDALIVFAPQ